MVRKDVVIIGASAAGLMCAIEAGKRGRKVIVLDRSNKAGKKILMSGGGRCNFTNYSVSAENYISHNPHFPKSALSRFTQWSFIELVNQYQIEFHERSNGQLFCNNSAKDILAMLITECEQAGVIIQLDTEIGTINKKSDQCFNISSKRGDFQCQSLVIASGGLSIPTLGGSAIGYQIAKQFDIKVWPTAAGLVPLTLQPDDKEKFSVLSGIAVDSRICCSHGISFQDICFQENILFTHRGLSGPAILQISSYWQPGEVIEIDLLPDIELVKYLRKTKLNQPKLSLKTLLSKYLPKRLAMTLTEPELIDRALHSITDHQLQQVGLSIKKWTIKPNGTQGYRTAEVTLGGVDCNALSSKTMETNSVSGLYFIGEVVDVTGWLGGYNFQWAWSSGWCAGQFV